MSSSASSPLAAEHIGRSRAVKWMLTAAALVLVPLLLAGVVVAFLWYGVLEVPDVGEPFDVAKFASVSIPVNENACTFYREAKSRLIEVNAILAKADAAHQEAFSKNYDRVLERGWPQANGDVRAWLAANQRTLEIWKRGAKCSKARTVLSTKDLDLGADLASTQSMRAFARLALLQAARAGAEGRPADSWEWYQAALRSSRHVGMHAPMIGRLVGTAIYVTAVEPVLRWSAEASLSNDELQRALTDVLVIDAMTPPTSQTIKSEYLVTRSRFDEMVLGGQLGPALALCGFRERTRRSVNVLYANLLSQVDRPRFERTPARGSHFPLFELDPKRPRDPNVLSPAEIEKRCLSSATVDVTLLNLMAPAFAALFDSNDRDQARRAVLIVGLALQVYRRDHGQYPETLDELVKRGYLKTLPADPFGKGEAMHYRRDAAGNGTASALVWSVWLDGIDEEGKVKADPGSEKSPGDMVYRITAPLTAPVKK